mmetsp:Transcript_2161/g.8349  ORF Transcript_2161/g.8349 Transcript_2161/m.8349 type:complete len:545 (+) Transcript_2161:171-1805(+)
MPLTLATKEREDVLFTYATELSTGSSEIPLEEGWKTLKENGISVLVNVLRGHATDSRPFGNKGYVSLYTISYRMCSSAGTCDHSKALYDRSKREMDVVLADVLKDLKGITVDEQSENRSERLLRRFAKHWASHKVMVKWMQQLFRHLDNGYVANSSAATLTSLGLKAFYDAVFIPLGSSICDSLLDMIDRNRDGADVDLSLVRSCLDVYPVMGLCSKVTDLRTVQAALSMQPDLSLYRAQFEKLFLARSAKYYAMKSCQWLEIESVPCYLRKVETVLREEYERVQQFLHVSSQRKVITVCERELLEKPRDEIVYQEQCGMGTLLAQERNQDLKRMFTLMRRVPHGLIPMAHMFKKYVLARGTAILKERSEHVAAQRSHAQRSIADDTAMIEKILALHRSMALMVSDLFGNESQFLQAKETALHDIMNSDATADHPNVLVLVTYTDRVLCGRVKLSDESLERTLEELLQLFLFVADKDSYAELYREQLAKRLLSKRYVSLHLEKTMIIKMKTQQGAPFTTKLEGMVNDFTIGILTHSWLLRLVFL